ncbi:MAG: SpaH/EbpB family LPXTG-anchored major pilin [Erysipelotrichaceae bacterium]|nr:SpaH/EbpB family LPXTG-anchored major pilin [Erysipelotrichaceae bacterium]MDY5251112.1 SpaH/EbpB family LPXTG-anchored major pilin [Erysipelotrichaceae bacterium]
MKKFIKVWIVIGLMMINFVDVSAQKNNVDETRLGSITLYKLISKDGAFKEGNGYEQDLSDVGNEPLAGVTFKYLQVGKMVQVDNEDRDNSGLYYLLNDDFKAWLRSHNIEVAYTMIDKIDYISAKGVNKIMKDLNTLTVAYGQDDGSQSGNELLKAYVDAKGIAMPITDKQGKTKVDNLELGLYLIVETAVNAMVNDGTSANVAKESRPFFISIPMTNLTMIDDHPAGSMWQYDVIAYPKNEMITIRKDIIASGNDVADGDATNGLVQKTDKQVGDHVRFLLSIDVPMLQPMADGVPNTNRKFIINDTLSAGLRIDDLSSNNFVVTLGSDIHDGKGNMVLEQGEHYDIVAKEDGFVLSMSKAGLSKLDQISTDSKLYVSYQARLTKEAVKDNGNIKEESNAFTLTYGTSVSADKEFASNQDIKIYTYEIDLKKSFSHEVDDISQVGFKVAYQQANNKYQPLSFVKEADGIYHLQDIKEKGSETINPDVKGNLIIKGLDDGTYEFKEIATIPGFNLLRDPIYVSLKKAYPEDGTLQQATLQSKNNEPIELTTGLEKGVSQTKGY